jgi:hypothetical protein
MTTSSHNHLATAKAAVALGGDGARRLAAPGSRVEAVAR